MPDYFYGAQADQFTFYRVPKVLFTDERYSHISPEAKTLYGILLDRMNLSVRNRWLDAQGRVYIIFTTEEIMKALHCGDNKATKLMNELEQKCGLIERKRQGLTRPNLIYVKNFASDLDFPEQRFQNRENHDSGIPEIPIQEPSKSRCSNTDKNYTENNNNDSFPSEGIEENGMFYSDYDSYFRDKLDIDALLCDSPDDADLTAELLALIVDTCRSTQKTIRIGRDDKPAGIVKSQFMKLTGEHIRFVLKGLHENTTRVRNIRQYLLTSLYNAPLTMSSYYTSLVNHDLHQPVPSKKEPVDLYDSSIPFEGGFHLWEQSR